jgi:hypothetical protein
VLENNVLRKIFGPMWEEGTQNLRKLYNEELREFCSSPNICMVNESRSKRWAGNVARRGYKRNVYNFVWEV